MMKRIFIALAAAVLMASCAPNPFLSEWETPYGIPDFAKIKERDYLPAIKKGIALQNAEIEAIVNNPAAPDFENTVAAFDRSGAVLSRVSAVLFNLSESDATDKLNSIVAEAMPLISEHSDNLMMNKALFERVKTVWEADQSALTREQQMLLKGLYEGFLDNGINLDEASQARLKAINSDLSSLSLSFANNLLAQSNAFKTEFGFPVSNYYDKMASTEDRALREKIFKAYSNRCNHGDSFDN